MLWELMPLRPFQHLLIVPANMLGIEIGPWLRTTFDPLSAELVSIYHRRPFRIKTYVRCDNANIHMTHNELAKDFHAVI
jgi:hypothetical protein